MKANLNEESVLRSFYEERKNRLNGSKRHSLLQKNFSYFSTNQIQPQQQVDPNLQQTNHFKSHDEHFSSYGMEHHQNHDFAETFRNNDKKYKKEDQPLILLAQEEREDVKSPSFKFCYEEEDQNQSPMIQTLPYRSLPLVKQSSEKSSNLMERDESFECQMRRMKEKIAYLQKENKIKQNFIDSVFDMRRKIDNAKEDCSLKELWRWVKKLPHQGTD